MPPAEDDDLDAAAERLIEEGMRPKRRVRPRLAEPLHDAEDREILTPAGPVMAWRLGNGPAALLVHGWEDDNALWEPMIDRLRANGRAVIAFDLPGHGYSAAELDGPDAAGKAVTAVAAAFGPIDAVIGHSFGCAAAIMAMDHGLEVRRAVLIASPIPKNRASILDRYRRNGVAPEVVDRAILLYAARESAAGPPFDIEAACRRMRAQALIVHSMDDEQCPPQNARILADAWPGSDLMWTDGLGHRRVAQDKATIQRAADFIEGLPIGA
jgi:pimeloyl-ACP methyl ester carboxylesterase